MINDKNKVHITVVKLRRLLTSKYKTTDFKIRTYESRYDNRFTVGKKIKARNVWKISIDYHSTKVSREMLVSVLGESGYFNFMPSPISVKELEKDLKYNSRLIGFVYTNTQDLAVYVQS